MYLENAEVVKWCYGPITEDSLKTTSNDKKLKAAQKIEKAWGNSIMGTVGGGQWTTKLCETLVLEALIELGQKNVKRAGKLKSSLREKRYSPDLECDEYVYEVKGRSWTSSGTAGEKILGVPLKYGEVPRLYKKPLRVVLVAYQEYEAREHYAFGDLLDAGEQTQELKDSLAFYKKQDIEYIGFTDILKKIKLTY